MKILLLAISTLSAGSSTRIPPIGLKELAGTWQGTAMAYSTYDIKLTISEEKGISGSYNQTIGELRVEGTIAGHFKREKLVIVFRGNKAWGEVHGKPVLKADKSSFSLENAIFVSYKLGQDEEYPSKADLTRVVP